MCGYYISSGYKGLVNGKWMLFATEAEYHEYMEELNSGEIATQAKAFSKEGST